VAENYVRIAIKADDEAKPDIDALKARLDELKAQRADINVDVEDKDAVAKATRIDAMIEDLSRKVASPKISLAGAARAEAQIAAVDLQMDKLKAKEDEQGIISRLLMGSGGSGGGLSGVLEKIPLLGGQLSKLTEGLAGVGEEGTSAGEALGSIGAGAGGILALVGVASAAAAEAGALATGLVAAGAGVASFGALAYPTFKQVLGAVGDTKSQLAKLPAPIREAVDSVKQLESGFDKMSKAFQPTALKVLNQGLGIANQLLPYIGQFAQAAAPAVEGLLSKLSTGLDSPSFKHFMSFLESLAGPVITAVGSGMEGLAKEVMRLMQSFSKKDVINAINIAFRIMGGVLEVVIALVKGGMHAWDQFSAAVSATHHAFDVARHAVASFAHDVAHYFDVARHAVASLAHDFAHYFDTVRHAVATAAHDISSAFDTVRHAIATVAHDFASAFDRIRHDIASWAHDIANDFDTVRHDIAAAVTAAVNWVVSHFESMRNRAKAKIGDLVSDVKALPGRILSALGNLGTLLFGAGQKIIGGLINGIESEAGKLIGKVEGLVSDVRSYLPFSPAKRGPLSGSGSPDIAGRKIGSMLAEGIRAGAGGVGNAMTHLTGAVSAGARGGGAAGGAGRLEITFKTQGTLLKAMQAEVRVAGGDPGMFQRKVAFR
jgi:phage-related protein